MVATPTSFIDQPPDHHHLRLTCVYTVGAVAYKTTRPQKDDLIIHTFRQVLAFPCHGRTYLINGIQLNLCKTAILKNTENWFSKPIIANAGQAYCRMLPLEHSAILFTFIKLPFIIRFLFCLFLSGRFTQVLLYYYHPNQLRPIVVRCLKCLGSLYV